MQEEINAAIGVANNVAGAYALVMITQYVVTGGSIVLCLKMIVGLIRYAIDKNN